MRGKRGRKQKFKVEAEWQAEFLNKTCIYSSSYQRSRSYFKGRSTTIPLYHSSFRQFVSYSRHLRIAKQPSYEPNSTIARRGLRPSHIINCLLMLDPMRNHKQQMQMQHPTELYSREPPNAILNEHHYRPKQHTTPSAVSEKCQRVQIAAEMKPHTAIVAAMRPGKMLCRVMLLLLQLTHILDERLLVRHAGVASVAEDADVAQT